MRPPVIAKEQRSLADSNAPHALTKFRQNIRNEFIRFAFHLFTHNASALRNALKHDHRYGNSRVALSLAITITAQCPIDHVFVLRG